MGATGDEIRCITGTTKQDPALACFITPADLKIVRVAQCDPSLSSDELDAIANWYASYLLAAGGSDDSLNVSKEKFEQYEKTFGGKSSESAADTYYKTANELSNGCLAQISAEKSQFLVL